MPPHEVVAHLTHITSLISSRQVTRAIVIVAAAVGPTSEQMAHHELTHFHCAEWCEHCVASRAVQLPRVSAPSSSDLLPVVQVGGVCPTALGEMGEADSS